MDAFTEFFTSIWTDWLAQTPANRLGIGLSVATVTILPFAGWLVSSLRVGDKNSRIKRLEDENAALTQERNRAKAEAANESAFADQWMPERWLEKAAREERDQNFEAAVHTLEIGFDNAAPGLARVARALAEHRSSLLA